jgi:hypothetical protein
MSGFHVQPPYEIYIQVYVTAVKKVTGGIGIASLLAVYMLGIRVLSMIEVCHEWCMLLLSGYKWRSNASWRVDKAAMDSVEREELPFYQQVTCPFMLVFKRALTGSDYCALEL